MHKCNNIHSYLSASS